MMKTRTKYMLLPVVTAGMLSLASAGLQAQQFGPGDAAGPGFDLSADNPGRMLRMIEELELSTDQRDRLFSISDEIRPRIRDNLFKVMDARRELRELMAGDDVSDRRLRQLTRDQADSMAEVMYLRMKMRSDMRDVLTEEQLARAEELRKNRPQRRFGRDFRPGREQMRERFRERRRMRDQQEQTENT